LSSIIKSSNLKLEHDIKINSNKKTTKVFNCEDDGIRDELADLKEKLNLARKKYNEMLKATETLKNEAVTYARELKINTYNEALKQGYDDAKDKIDKEIKKRTKNLENEYQDKLNLINKKNTKFLCEVREKMSSIVTDIVEAVILREVKTDTDIINSMIINQISKLIDIKEINIRMAEVDFNTLDKSTILKHCSSDYNITFSVDKNMSQGDCILDTNCGFVDISISNLLESIKTIVADNIYLGDINE